MPHGYELIDGYFRRHALAYNKMDALIIRDFFGSLGEIQKEEKERRRRERLRQSGICEYNPYRESSWHTKSVSGSPAVVAAAIKSSKTISEGLVARARVAFTEESAAKSNDSMPNVSYEDCERRIALSLNLGSLTGQPSFLSLYRSSNPPTLVDSKSNNGGTSTSGRTLSNATFEDCT